MPTVVSTATAEHANSAHSTRRSYSLRARRSGRIRARTQSSARMPTPSATPAKENPAMRLRRTNSAAASRTGSVTEDAGRLPETTFRRSLSISDICAAGIGCWPSASCAVTRRVRTLSWNATHATNTKSAGMAHHIAVSSP